MQDWLWLTSINAFKRKWKIVMFNRNCQTAQQSNNSNFEECPAAIKHQMKALLPFNVQPNNRIVKNEHVELLDI